MQFCSPIGIPKYRIVRVNHVQAYKRYTSGMTKYITGLTGAIVDITGR